MSFGCVWFLRISHRSSIRPAEFDPVHVVRGKRGRQSIAETTTGILDFEVDHPCRVYAWFPVECHALHGIGKAERQCPGCLRNCALLYLPTLHDDRHMGALVCEEGQVFQRIAVHHNQVGIRAWRNCSNLTFHAQNLGRIDCC